MHAIRGALVRACIQRSKKSAGVISIVEFNGDIHCATKGNIERHVSAHIRNRIISRSNDADTCGNDCKNWEKNEQTN